MKYLTYVTCALVLIGLVALLPAAAAPPAGGIDVEASVSADGGLSWFDADTPPGPTLLSTGPAPQFRFNVTNLGGSALTGLTLTDTVLGTITVPGNLVGGASVEVIVTGTWAAGQQTSVATASGSRGGDVLTDTDASNYFGSVPAQPPVAAFTAVPTSGTAPLDVQFTDESTGSGITAWSWTFGDGATSSEQSPAHTYTAPGTYTVVLTVTGPGGSDSEVKADVITVSAAPVPPVAAFSATPTSGTAPLAVTFTDASIGAPTSWAWDFGDGGSSAEQNPGHTYTAPGTYTVNLTVTSADGSDSETKTGYITVSAAPVPPVAGFSAAPTSGAAPLDVQFTDESTGGVITAWSWTFGDGGISSEQSPSHAYTAPGSYAVNLTVTNADGSDSEVKTDYITVTVPQHPSVSIEVRTNGEDADTPPGPSITIGSPVQWTYVVTNTGNVALANVAVTDDQGVVVSAPKTVLQPGESMTATASGTAVLGQYANLGTVTASPPVGQAVTASDPSHYLGVGTPAIDFETYVSADGGATWVDADAPPGPYVLAGTAPIFRFVTTNTGGVPLSMVNAYGHLGPIAQLAPGESFEATEAMTWEAGQHLFGAQASGTYNGQTVMDQDGAWYFGAAPAIAVEALTNGEDADTPPGPSITVGNPVQWTYVVTNTGNVALANVAVTDDRGVIVSAPKTALEPGESMTATASGTAVAGPYTNVGTVTATPPVGQAVTASDPSHYLGVDVTPPAPVAAFSATPTSGVAPLAVTFTDASTGTPTSWAWDFGDGEISVDQSPSHTYAAPGTYTVNLTVTNADGSDSEGKTDYISVTAAPVPPVAAFSATPTSGVAPLAVQFTDASTGSGISAWSWTFGDGATSSEQSPSHTYTAPGTYTVLLTVIGVGGSDSEVKTDYITVSAAPVPPVAAFGATPTSGDAPLTVTFTDASTGAPTSWSWSFGDGGSSNLQNPVHTYDTAGTYSVNLTVANADGSDSEAKTGYITVSAPPIAGADRAYYLVSTVPAGAEIYLEDLGGTRYLQGTTSAGPLNVTLCLTCVPIQKIVATLPGYLDAVYPIGQYPAEGQTVPVTLTLERETPGPFPGPHIPWTIIQAEDYDLGGEGVAYHDVETANLGGRYRNEGVDIETEAGVTNVGWIRAGEYLKYTIDTTIAGDFYLTLRAANPDLETKAVTVYLDGVPAGQVMVGRTGAWTTFADFTGAAPMIIPAGRHVVTLSFEGINRINIDWLRLAAGIPPTVTPAEPASASFTATPVTAPHGAAVKFTLTPAPGKTVRAAWWSFDAPTHLRTWNSRTINPTFFYPRSGTFSPLVRITYTDGTVEEVHRLTYIRAT